MKLYYFQRKEGNFGDDLNDWLWEKLIPNTFDSDEKKVFFGIGTIINDRIYDRAPNADKIIVFGSGVGYGKTPLANLPVVNSDWKIYCVRGPLSAEVLGINAKLAITDGAVLIRKLFEFPNTKRIYRFSYMPHVNQAVKHRDVLTKVCSQLGYGYIDPCWSREKVLSSLCQTETIITEAMHGAIVADALRIPWIPVKTNKSLFEFKWQDWCKSVGLSYQPQTIAHLGKGEGMKSRATKWLTCKKIHKQMKEIAEFSPCFLSQDSKIEEVTSRLEEKYRTSEEM